MFNRLTHFFLFMYLRYFSFVLFNFVLMSFPQASINGSVTYYCSFILSHGDFRFYYF